MPNLTISDGKTNLLKDERISTYDNDVGKSKVSYLRKRLQNISVNPNCLKVRVQREGTTGTYSVEMDLIEPNKNDGIDFYHVCPDGSLYEFRPKDDKTKHHQKFVPYISTRNHPDQLKGNPNLPKYLATGGEGSIPWLPPITIKHSKEKTKADALWIGEGALKVLSLQPHNICGIGVQGIHNTRYNDNGTKIVHPFISQVIENCEPGSIIYFQDSDCRDIKENVIFSDGKLDMLERSLSFYKAIDNFQKSVLPIARKTKAKVLFVAIKKEALEGDPKGLDDLLQTASSQGKKDDVLNEIEQINKGKHRAEYKYFEVFDITRNTIKVKRWFCLHSHKEFAKLHLDEIEDTKCRMGNKIYFVERDEKNDTDAKLELLNDARVNLYMKIGTTYYKKCRIPFNDGNDSYLGRIKTDKGTIQQQIGIEGLKKVKIYDWFCNIPNYKDHREAVGNFYNLQHPLPKPIYQSQVKEKQVENILSLFEHIGKNATIEHNGQQLEGKELLLDYIQLLLFHRQGIAVQRLPILCLVSQEEGTGKSTFADFLINELLGDNHIKIQNSNFSSDFNEPYVTRRATTIEEANFQKKDLNNLKDLTGSDFIVVNGKNDKEHKAANILVLIMVSNDEKRFSFVSKDDTRHWVIKINTLNKKDVSIKDKIKSEISYFYKYLLDRPLYLEQYFPDNIDRYYFPPFTIRTKAWHKAVRYSLPKDCEPIRDYIEELFYLFQELGKDIEAVHYTAKDIRELVFDGKGNDRLIGEYLRDYFSLKYKSYTKSGKGQNSRYKKYSIIIDSQGNRNIENIGNNAKCFVFERKDFISTEMLPQGNNKGNINEHGYPSSWDKK